MGNSSFDGVPYLVAKNWQKTASSNLFKNKHIKQYAHRYIVKIEDPAHLQSFKARMKETNPYICRVLLYHQHDENTYHVYTEQMGENIDLNYHGSSSHGSNFKQNQIDKWSKTKIGIYQAFWALSKIFGFFKVCRQMVGYDGNGNFKIWIHPDPYSHKPWCSAFTESQMLYSLILVMQQIQQERNLQEQNLTKESRNNFSFAKMIEGMKIKLEEYYMNVGQAKSGISKSGSLSDPSMQVSLDMDLESSQKDSTKIGCNFVVSEISRDDQDTEVCDENENIKGQSVYETQGTTRDRPISYYKTQDTDVRRRGSDTVKSLNLFGFSAGKHHDSGIPRDKNPTHHCPVTVHSACNTIQESVEHYYSYDHDETIKYGDKNPLHVLLHSSPKNTHLEHLSGNNYPQNSSHITTKQPRHQKSYWQIQPQHQQHPVPKHIHQHRLQYAKSNQPSNQKLHSINQAWGASSSKFIHQNSKIRSLNDQQCEFTEIQSCKLILNKSNSNEPAHLHNPTLHCKKNASYQEGGIDHHYEIKNNNFSSAFVDPSHFNKNSIPTERFNPQHRPNRTKQKPIPSKSNTNNKTLLQFYCNKFSSPNKNNRTISNTKIDKRNLKKNHLKQEDKKQKYTQQCKNTTQILKEQLSGILNLKMGDNDDYLQEQNKESEQTKMIRQKVEKKKATFAHLKMQVMKMLEN